MSNTIRILTINVWSGLSYMGITKIASAEPAGNREARYNVLVSSIRKLDPDLIAVQEANLLPKFIDQLAIDLAMDSVARVGLSGVRLGPLMIPSNLCQGDAILARKGMQLTYVARKRLSGGFCGENFSLNWSDTSQIICTRVNCRDQPLFVFATHWHSSPYFSYLDQISNGTHGENFTKSQRRYARRQIQSGILSRKREARKTMAFINKFARRQNCVLLGDLNTERSMTEFKYLVSEGGFQDSSAVATTEMQDRMSWDPERNLNQKMCYQANYIATKPLSRKYLYYRIFEDFNRQPRTIDHILSRGTIKAKECRLVLDDQINGIHASDHFGIFAKFEIQNEKLN